jgi:hypothetical protein
MVCLSTDDGPSAYQLGASRVARLRRRRSPAGDGLCCSYLGAGALITHSGCSAPAVTADSGGLLRPANVLLVCPLAGSSPPYLRVRRATREALRRRCRRIGACARASRYRPICMTPE